MHRLVKGKLRQEESKTAKMEMLHRSAQRSMSRWRRKTLFAAFDAWESAWISGRMREDRGEGGHGKGRREKSSAPLVRLEEEEEEEEEERAEDEDEDEDEDDRLLKMPVKSPCLDKLANIEAARRRSALVLAQREGLIADADEIDRISGIDEETALIRAASQGNSEHVGLLLRAGSQLDVRNRQGYTALNSAATGGYAEICKMLLEHRADVELENRHGETPLHSSCLQGKLDCVELLLYHRASLLAVSSEGMTPVLCASRGGHTEIVELLVEEGGKKLLLQRSLDGKNCLHVAALHGHLDLLRKLWRLDGVRMAVDKDDKGWTCVHHACEGGHHRVLQYLINKCRKEQLLEVLQARTRQGRMEYRAGMTALEVVEAKLMLCDLDGVEEDEGLRLCLSLLLPLVSAEDEKNMRLAMSAPIEVLRKKDVARFLGDD